MLGHKKFLMLKEKLTKETMKKINEWFKEKTKDKDGKEKILYQRERAKKQFKAIMIFIDKKGFMPLGDY